MPKSDDTLSIVANTDEHPGYVTFGVIYQGAFIPLGAQKAGHVEAAVQAAKASDEKSGES